MTVFIVSHKEYDFPQNDDYKVIQVGSVFNANYIADSLGVNIAHKNSNYCELTALYWMCNNVEDEYLGLVHYRRFFTIDGIGIPYKNIRLPSNIELIEFLGSSDLIVPRVRRMNTSVLENYASSHFVSDWIAVGDAIKLLYPEYIESFVSVSLGNEIYPCNMIYGKKTIINEYCNWLLKILFEVESKININSYDAYQLRVFGFLSERLFKVWLDHNKKDIKELAICNVESNGPKVRSVFSLNSWEKIIFRAVEFLGFKDRFKKENARKLFNEWIDKNCV